MSWVRTWLGDLGAEDYRRRVTEWHRSAARVAKDRNQDEQIDELRRENQELKLYLAGLLKLLVNKGTITAQEIEDLVVLVERAEAEAQKPRTEPTSDDLQAIAAAAKEMHGA